MGSRTRRPGSTTFVACTTSILVHFILSQICKPWGAEPVLTVEVCNDQWIWPCWAVLFMVLLMTSSTHLWMVTSRNNLGHLGPK